MIYKRSGIFIPKTEQILCYQCEKKTVKERFDLCADCTKKHEEWKIKQQQEKMRGNQRVRILRCDKCKGTKFRFVWEYDPRSEFNMIWCHDGIGFELDQSVKLAVMIQIQTKI